MTNIDKIKDAWDRLIENAANEALDALEVLAAEDDVFDCETPKNVPELE